MPADSPLTRLLAEQAVSPVEVAERLRERIYDLIRRGPVACGLPEAMSAQECMPSVSWPFKWLVEEVCATYAADAPRLAAAIERGLKKMRESELSKRRSRPWDICRFSV